MLETVLHQTKLNGLLFLLIPKITKDFLSGSAGASKKKATRSMHGREADTGLDLAGCRQWTAIQTLEQA